jgi:hypothetical protein
LNIIADLIITSQDELPGPDGEAPHVLFVNETNDGNTRFLRTNVLSDRPDLKKYTSLRFQQDLKQHPDAMGPGEDLVLVFLEAIEMKLWITPPSNARYPFVAGYPMG